MVGLTFGSEFLTTKAIPREQAAKQDKVENAKKSKTSKATKPSDPLSRKFSTALTRNTAAHSLGITVNFSRPFPARIFGVVEPRASLSGYALMFVRARK